jgi:pyruvate dehydrogenase E2 component (dihydrolipoamide acetyltransferase)
LARILEAWLEAMSIRRAHLVGHSLGGTLAILIATTSPDRVASLSLVAPAGLGTEISSDFLDGFISETRARKLRPVLEKLVAHPSLVSADMVEEVLKFKRLDGATDALRRVADSIAANGRQLISVRDRLAALSLPIQVIWGEQDRILPVQHSQGLAERIEVIRFADAGHIPHMEKAAEVNAVLRRFATNVNA